MQRFAKKIASGKIKIENENFGNKTFQRAELRKCSVLRKKSFWEAKNRKNENFENKTFQSAELRKFTVLRKKSFWEAKNRKMKTLEIRRSRMQNSGNAAFCKKK